MYVAIIKINLITTKFIIKITNLINKLVNAIIVIYIHTTKYNLLKCPKNFIK